MQGTGAAVVVGNVEVGSDQSAVGGAGRKRSVHDGTAVAAVGQSQDVAQLVYHRRLEIVLSRTDLRRIAAGVPAAALDHRHLVSIGGAAEYTLGQAAQRTGRVHG